MHDDHYAVTFSPMMAGEYKDALLRARRVAGIDQDLIEEAGQKACQEQFEEGP